MVWIILATGLGTANFIAYALLFRRARQLARQLSDMRAEHNSEWILNALQGVQEGHQHAAIAAAGIEPPINLQAVRRKKHLGLIMGGGGIAAILSAVGDTTRQAWQTRRGTTSAAFGATVISTALTALVLASLPNGSDSSRPPSAAPTRTIAVTVSETPGHTPQAPPTGPAALDAEPQSVDASTPTPEAPISHSTTLTPNPGQTGTANSPPSPSGLPPSPTAGAPIPTESPTGVTVPVDFLRCVAIVASPFLRAKLCRQEGG